MSVSNDKTGHTPPPPPPASPNKNTHARYHAISTPKTQKKRFCPNYALWQWVFQDGDNNPAFDATNFDSISQVLSKASKNLRTGISHHCVFSIGFMGNLLLIACKVPLIGFASLIN
jgi:hypothetical protein